MCDSVNDTEIPMNICQKIIDRLFGDACTALVGQDMGGGVNGNIFFLIDEPSEPDSNEEKSLMLLDISRLIEGEIRELYEKAGEKVSGIELERYKEMSYKDIIAHSLKETSPLGTLSINPYYAEYSQHGKSFEVALVVAVLELENKERILRMGQIEFTTEEGKKIERVNTDHPAIPAMLKNIKANLPGMFDLEPSIEMAHLPTQAQMAIHLVIHEAQIIRGKSTRVVH